MPAPESSKKAVHWWCLTLPSPTQKSSGGVTPPPDQHSGQC